MLTISKVPMDETPQKSPRSLTPKPRYPSVSRKSPSLERIAPSPDKIPTIWLRTCYSEGSDRSHEALVRSIDRSNTTNGECRILNDANHCDFGDDWEQLFDICPELLQPPREDWALHQRRQHEAKAALKRFAEGGLASIPSALFESLSYCGGEDLEEFVGEVLQSGVHKTHVVTRLILEDEEAVQTGNVAVMFVDALGRIVRMKRIEVGELEHLNGVRVDAHWDDMVDWEEGKLGEEYQLGGMCEDLLLENIRNA
ncbi:MAG: hypothetical protein Q9170_002978 [Blastenia crenularia]